MDKTDFVEKHEQKELRKILFSQDFGKKTKIDVNIKTVINKVKKFSYSDKIKFFLLSLNNPFLSNKSSIFPFISNMELPHQEFVTQVFTSWIIEKFIVFGDNNGKEELLKKEFIDIYNDHRSLKDIELSDENIFLSNLFFMLYQEQITLQEKNYDENFLRIKNLFEDCEISQNIIKNKLGMDLGKFYSLCCALLVFLGRENKTKFILNIEEFKKFVMINNNGISDVNVKNFIEFLTISIDDFKKEYFEIRKNRNGSILTYESQTKIDKYLPKISYLAPLYKDNNEIIYITSFTALKEFLKMDRVYYEIVEKNSIKDYKSLYFGKLIEKYVRKTIKKFLIENNIQEKQYLMIGSDYKYKVNRNEFESPDIVLELNDFIIVIECKTSAFHLIKSIHSFNKNISNQIQEDLNKSKTNLDRFIKHKKYENKKIFKFLMYFNAKNISLSAIADFLKEKEFLIVDISVIEILFQIEKEKMIIALNDYFVNININDKPLSLKDHLLSYASKNRSSEVKNESEKIIRKELSI